MVRYYCIAVLLVAQQADQAKNQRTPYEAALILLAASLAASAVVFLAMLIALWLRRKYQPPEENVEENTEESRSDVLSSLKVAGGVGVSTFFVGVATLVYLTLRAVVTEALK